jgi:Flp pilus assembly protein TadB
MARIRGESEEDPQNENITSQDVTSEYVDLQSRLKNLEAAEVELTQIMQDANRTEDVLSVYQQLVSIREQIEVIKGQIKYYDQASALSAISVELIADAAVQPIVIAGWQPQGVAKEAVEALLRTMQGVATAAIWVVIYLLPTLLVLFVIFGLPLVLLFRFLRRRSLARQTVAAKPVE